LKEVILFLANGIVTGECPESKFGERTPGSSVTLNACWGRRHNVSRDACHATMQQAEKPNLYAANTESEIPMQAKGRD